MLGDDLRAWFELFDGIAIYRPKPGGGHHFDGWINWSDIEKRFTSSNLTFAGARYDPKDEAQRNRLLDAIVDYAATFVFLRLLERRRKISPPSLDFKLTSFGRRVGNWGYGAQPGFKKRAFFFIAAVSLRAYKYKGVIAFGAAGWAVLNAIKFYAAATSWATALPFAAWSATVVSALAVAWIFIKARVG